MSKRIIPFLKLVVKWKLLVRENVSRDLSHALDDTTKREYTFMDCLCSTCPLPSPPTHQWAQYNCLVYLSSNTIREVIRGHTRLPMTLVVKFFFSCINPCGIIMMLHLTVGYKVQSWNMECIDTRHHQYYQSIY